MKITVLFFSTNRLEFLIPTIKSFYKYVDFGDNEVYSILIDDYPKERNNEIFSSIKRNYKIDKLILHEENMGYSKSWKEGWDNVPNDSDYIFHQEDDFIFNKKININELLDIFKVMDNKLYQIVLKRQVWFEKNDLIYKIENNIIESKEIEVNVNNKNHTLIINNHLFNSNPCIYPYFITKIKFDNTIHEHTIIENIKKIYPNMNGCIYGKKKAPPIITHIGDYTQGKKLVQGDLCYELFKDYDPLKKYDAKKWLCEYNHNCKFNENHFLYFLELENTLLENNRIMKINKLQSVIDINTQLLDAYYYLMLEYQNNKEHLKAYTTGLSAGNDWKKQKYFYDEQEERIYTYLFRLNLAVNAYYSEFYNEAYMINKELMIEYPDDKILIQNQKFYLSKVNTNFVPELEKKYLMKYFNNSDPRISIIEDFYKNPYEIRDFALKQEFNVGGNFPGKRTKSFKKNYHKAMFENILNKKITYWPEEYNGSFQIVTENYKSWIHRDQTEYSAIIFLTPEPEISTGGTVFYKHKKTGLFKDNNDEDKKILDDSSNSISDWESTDTVGNIFNRCLIFKGKYNHKSNKYFGDCLKNGRLFQIFFFD